jgi:hypothetical protein
VSSIISRAEQGYFLHGTRRPEKRLADLCEDCSPPKQATIASLARHYLCQGIHSKCWECYCGDRCEYGKRYMELLRQRVKKQKHGWRGYDCAASPLIRAEYLAGREAAAKDRDDQHQRVRKQESNQESKKGTRKNDD